MPLVLETKTLRGSTSNASVVVLVSFSSAQVDWLTYSEQVFRPSQFTEVCSRETQLRTIEKKPATQKRSTALHRIQGVHCRLQNPQQHWNTPPKPCGKVPPLLQSRAELQSYSLYFDTTESGRAKPSNAAKANVLQSWAHVRINKTGNIDCLVFLFRQRSPM